MALTRDRIGNVIAERYELLDVIGRGGQGLVYKGYDRWTERNVAVKLLASKQAREPQMAQRMIREQQAMTALKGTAAVELFDVCRGSDGELCLVMELLSGIDLEEHLYALEDRGERLDLYRVGEIFDPIVDTLEVAHDAGILHRDLKPANVFLLDYGGVRLLDFGLARLRTGGAPLTAAGTVMGSPSYIAPEAWQGRTEVVDHRADVYSLGVILFRLLAGELPFSGETLHEKFLGSTKSERPSLLARRADLPPSADDWVEMALAIDREDRFSNVRALWNAFTETFDVKPPRRKPRESLWSAAKHAIEHLAHGSDKPLPAPAPRPAELSFVSEALAKSVAPMQDKALGPPPPPRRNLPAPPPAPFAARREHTVELTDIDLEEAPPSKGRSIEKTLELTDLDLVFAEDTIPGARVPFPEVVPVLETPEKQQEKKRKNEKKRARAERRKKRKQRRKKRK